MKYRQVEAETVEPCVAMACCGFTFSADHPDDTEEGGYSCPQCSPATQEDPNA